MHPAGWLFHFAPTITLFLITPLPTEWGDQENPFPLKFNYFYSLPPHLVPGDQVDRDKFHFNWELRFKLLFEVWIKSQPAVFNSQHRKVFQPWCWQPCGFSFQPPDFQSRPNSIRSKPQHLSGIRVHHRLRSTVLLAWTWGMLFRYWETQLSSTCLLQECRTLLR